MSSIHTARLQPYQTILLSLSVTSFLLITFLSSILPPSITAYSLDTCLTHSKPLAHSSTLHSILIPRSDSLVNLISIYLFWTCIILQLLTNTLYSTTHFWTHLSQILFSSIWFHNTYWILYFLKCTFYDPLCAHKSNPLYPNSISGHYCYFSFCFLMLHYYYSLNKQPFSSFENNRKSIVSGMKLISQIVVVFYAWFACMTLYRTYTHGYHSARQCVYGSCMGIVSAILLETVLMSNNNKIRYNMIAALLLSCTLSGTAAEMMWRWKLNTTVISSTQILSQSTGWIALVSIKYCHDNNVIKFNRNKVSID
mmetsp:Transcript_10144/g.18271  ORF Transcript_10144/g.18271 Transcript_10144/m.18271 type:complete len:310 (-) Transcript_10144:665-1594(-)